MTDLGNHDDPHLVKYTPVSYQYAGLWQEVEFRLISPFGLQYDRRRYAQDWDRDEGRDRPFNWEYFKYGPQRDWIPINLGQQIELCAAFFNVRRRLKHVKRSQSSYGIKHQVERDGKTYVVNGAVIMAARRLGLIVKSTHDESANAFFNIGSVVW
jgi:hypothetical protein